MPEEVRKCEICGKLLVNQQKKFCSDLCRGKAKTLNNTILCIYKYCEKEFRISKSHFNRSEGEGSFCSRECRGKSETTKIKRNCLFCGKEFEAYLCRIKNNLGKYCSKDCADRDRANKYFGENSSNWKGGPKIITCLHCGKDFIAPRSRINIAKYCSRECSGLHNWKDIQIYIDNGYKISLNYGEYILEHRQVVSEIMGRKLLMEEVVHHKDFNKKNNNPSNLALFANQSAHMKYHMTGIITNCIWDLGGVNLCYQETFVYV
ncbi:MAG: HNH endonuclease [Phycisphaerae bacterium]|jgi:hypothetical protein